MKLLQKHARVEHHLHHRQFWKRSYNHHNYITIVQQCTSSPQYTTIKKPTTLKPMPVSNYMWEPHQNHSNSTKSARVHNTIGVLDDYLTCGSAQHMQIKALANALGSGECTGMQIAHSTLATRLAWSLHHRCGAVRGSVTSLMRWSLPCYLHLRSSITRSQWTHTCPSHSDVTSDTCIITLLTCAICDVRLHRAASRCMLILILVNSGAPCS